MRHLKIEVIGYGQPLMVGYNNIWYKHTAPLGTIKEFTDPILRVEIDKETWDAMFNLYEAHLSGFKNAAVQDAWDQYITLLHLTGEDTPLSQSQVGNYKL